MRVLNLNLQTRMATLSLQDWTVMWNGFGNICNFWNLLPRGLKVRGAPPMKQFELVWIFCYFWEMHLQHGIVIAIELFSDFLQNQRISVSG